MLINGLISKKTQIVVYASYLWLIIYPIAVILEPFGYMSEDTYANLLTIIINIIYFLLFSFHVLCVIISTLRACVLALVRKRYQRKQLASEILVALLPLIILIVLFENRAWYFFVHPIVLLRKYFLVF